MFEDIYLLNDTAYISLRRIERTCHGMRDVVFDKNLRLLSIPYYKGCDHDSSAFYR